jgi:hypothetical protein
LENGEPGLRRGDRGQCDARGVDHPGDYQRVAGVGDFGLIGAASTLRASAQAIRSASTK